MLRTAATRFGCTSTYLDATTRSSNQIGDNS